MYSTLTYEQFYDFANWLEQISPSTSPLAGYDNNGCPGTSKLSIWASKLGQLKLLAQWAASFHGRDMPCI